MFRSATGLIFKYPPQPMEGAAHHYQTYAIRQKPDVTIPAACYEVGCEAWLNGWESPVDESDPAGAQMAAWLRSGGSGRTFRELGRDEAGRTVFRFERHQRCFLEHQSMPRRLLVVHGDWRKTFGTMRNHTSAADWLEDAVENVDRVWSRVAAG